MKKLLSLLSLSAMLLVSCSKTDTPTSPGNGTTSGASSMSATINGTATKLVITVPDSLAINFTYIPAAPDATFFSIITGDYTSSDSALFTLAGAGNMEQGKTYDIGPDATTSVPGFSLAYVKIVNGAGVNYGTDAGRAKVGTITITTLSTSSIQGTFTATLPRQTNTTDGAAAAVITNGAFTIYHH